MIRSIRSDSCESFVAFYMSMQMSAEFVVVLRPMNRGLKYDNGGLVARSRDSGFKYPRLIITHCSFRKAVRPCGFIYCAKGRECALSLPSVS